MNTLECMITGNLIQPMNNKAGSLKEGGLSSMLFMRSYFKQQGYRPAWLAQVNFKIDSTRNSYQSLAEIDQQLKAALIEIWMRNGTKR